MTKKHFIALANYLTDNSLFTYCSTYENNTLVDVKDLRAHLANFCRSQNSAFKTKRWLDYIKGKCGPNGGKL